MTIVDATARATSASLEAPGLVTAVSFAIPERWFYTKAMRRRQNSASIVTVASDGVRIALGGVAPRPVRATAAEAALAEGDIDEARPRLSVEAADPFDDAYASAWYRRRVLPVHVRRALSEEPMPSSVIELERQRRADAEFLAQPGTTLLSALRDTLGLTAAKRGCGVGHVRHVHVPARRRGRDVLPGPGRDRQRLDASRRSRASTPPTAARPLQQAFLDGFATQCGFCTPGMIMAAEALLAENPTPTRDDVVRAISGNVCRCTGYESIIDAILDAAGRIDATS